MKSLNFKRQENAQLRFIEEQVTGKRKTRFNWDRIVYLTILGLIVFFVLRYFFLQNFYIAADGQIIFDSVEISETEDLRIEKYYFDEGDNIHKGDTLFTYLIQDPELAMANAASEEANSGSSWANREIYSLQKSIELNNSQARGDRDLLESYRKQLKRMENDVILGTASERDLNNLEYQISKLETSISLVKSENGVLIKQLNALKLDGQAILENSAEGLQNFSPYKAFISPVDGYVARIYKEPYEVALKSQVILNIYQADSVYVKGYFEQEDLKYVKVGDIIAVNFPDGQVSDGIIKRFYSSTVLIPEEFQKKFEPAKRTIAVDIIPAPDSDLELWKRYYKLSVKLTKRTF